MRHIVLPEAESGGMTSAAILAYTVSVDRARFASDSKSEKPDYRMKWSRAFSFLYCVFRRFIVLPVWVSWFEKTLDMGKPLIPASRGGMVSCNLSLTP